MAWLTLTTPQATSPDARISKSPSSLCKNGKQSLFPVFLRLCRKNPITGCLYGSAEFGFVYPFFGKNDGFVFGVRRFYTFDGEMIADAVIDVTFAHRAYHAIDFQCSSLHFRFFLPLLLQLALANRLTRKNINAFPVQDVAHDQRHRSAPKNEDECLWFCAC